MQHKDALFVKAGRYVQGPPAVKYRGIFLNDEGWALSPWVKGKIGDYNSKFYTKVFELLLRLKANYLWPAMWNNAFDEDDPNNPRLADEYGIVMGNSHQEPMLRAKGVGQAIQQKMELLYRCQHAPKLLAGRRQTQQELRKHYFHWAARG